MKCLSATATAWTVLLVAVSVALLPAAAAQPIIDGSAAPDPEQEASQLVVRVEAEIPGHGRQRAAGILFASQGNFLYIVTADHAVRRGMDEAAVVRVELRAFPGALLEALLLEVHDRQDDIAVLRVDRPSWIPADFGSSLRFDRLGEFDQLERRSNVIPMGHPRGERWYAPPEPVKVVKVVDRQVEIEMGCDEGFSGGALFDQRWNLVAQIQRSGAATCEAMSIHSVLSRVEKDWRLPVDLSLASDRDIVLPIDDEKQHPGGREISVAVAPLDYPSGTARGSDMGLMGQQVLNALLTSMAHVRTVTRERLTEVWGERMISVALGDQENRAALATGFTGTDYLVAGSILESSVERRRFRGFGVNGVADHYRIAISLQVIDLLNGEVKLAGTFDHAHQERYSSASAPRQPARRDYELISAVIDKSRPALVEVLYGSGAQRGPVVYRTVRIDTTPSGADVLVDGLFVGNTPADVELREGIRVVVLRRQGYEPWSQEVSVDESTPGIRVPLIRQRYRAPQPPPRHPGDRDGEENDRRQPNHRGGRAEEPGTDPPGGRFLER